MRSNRGGMCFSFVLSSTPLRQDDHIPYNVVWDEQDKSKSWKATPEISLHLFLPQHLCNLFSLLGALGWAWESRYSRVLFFRFLVFSSFTRLAFLISVPPSPLFCSHCILDDVVCIKSTNSPPGWCLFFPLLSSLFPLFPAFSVPVSSKPSSRVSIWVRGCHYMKMGGLCFSDAMPCLFIIIILCPFAVLQYRYDGCAGSGREGDRVGHCLGGFYGVG